VTLVHGMLKKATELKDLLVSRGMSEKLLDDLTASLGEFEQTLEATRASVRDREERVLRTVQQPRSLCTKSLPLSGALSYYRTGGRGSAVGGNMPFNRM